MIDLTKVSEIRNVLNSKVIDKIEDELGRIIYEGWKKLIDSGIPPFKIFCKGEDLIDYKIYGNSEQEILPNEYQQVEYIEGTGTQYLEIDYIASNITNSKGTYQITNMTSALMLFGSRKDGNSNGYALNWGASTTPATYFNTYYSGGTAGLTKTQLSDGISTFEKKGRELYINAELIHTHAEVSAFTTPYKMIVFGCNSGGTISYFAKAKIFNLQFYDNDELKVDLIPCYRKSDNEIGMYDTITGTFYINKGTGTFAKGSDITPIPTPETPIEIESVGEKTSNLFDLQNATFTNSTGSLVERGLDYFIVESNSTATNSTPGSTAWSSGWVECRFNPFEYGKTYTISYDVEFIEKIVDYDFPKQFRVLLNDSDNNIFNSVEVYVNELNIPVHKSKTITINSFSKFVFTCNSSKVRISNFQIVEGDVEKEFEPYGYRIPVKVSNGTEEIKTNIYLKEPLRKFGDYVDYIDFKNKKVVRRIGNDFITFVNSKSSLSGSYTIFLTPINNKTYIENSGNTVNYTKGFAVSNKFLQNKKVYYDLLSNGGYIQTYKTSGGIDCLAYSFNDSSITTIEQAQEKIGDGFDVNYILATPTEEDIELPKIPTLKGTTIIEVDTKIQPSNMEVTYIGK